MGSVILAIDQGTTGSTIALMDTSGVVIASASHEFPQLFPQPGWVEHDPESIWQSVLKGVDKVFSESTVTPADVITIGITNQRETAILWDSETGEALHNAIVWQCRRTTDVCQQLKEAGHEPMVRDRAGLVLDPYFSASKYRWLLDHAGVTQGDIDSGRVLAGTVDSYLLWRLTGGAVHATDVSNAARTSLMNLETLAWDSSLCDLFGVPMRILPTIMPSSTRYGVTASAP